MSVPSHIDVQGVRMPTLVYGTAWKEERTEPLVRQALEAGFRGIDTANQRKHYHEAGVGAALREALAYGLVARADLFVQTKFTHLRGQDHRLPYDPAAPLAEQVAQSFQRSLEHLGVDHLDSYVLHGPAGARGLSPADWEAWGAMEALQRAGRTRILGVSNVSMAQLAELHAGASVKPAVVQNRTLVHPHADRDVRAFCRERGMAYQGFSLLTAAPALLAHPAVRSAAARAASTPAAMMLRFWLEQGVVVLTGTSSREHMAQDLAARDATLLPEESAAILRALG
ncbi:MAG TPA: aldo/keto reductase [Candidatus Thermoplasmatota archaeon]|nr:aldo/keto reductase [Candidatus Thermoplasmatota archaeon]